MVIMNLCFCFFNICFFHNNHYLYGVVLDMPVEEAEDDLARITEVDLSILHGIHNTGKHVHESILEEAMEKLNITTPIFPNTKAWGMMLAVGFSRFPLVITI